jgi:hypothetical protein
MQQFTLDNTIDNATYFLPESWEETTFNQYLEIVDAQNDAKLTEHEKAAKVVSILSRIPLETVNEAGIALVIELYKLIEFTTVAPVTTAISHVTINGTTYYAQEITKFGEFTTFGNIQARFQDNPLAGIPDILAILLRKGLPVTEKAPKQPFWKRLFGKEVEAEQPELLVESFSMEGYSIEKRAKLFANQLNPVQVMSLAAFFLNNGKASMLFTQFYSENQDIVTKLKKSLVAISAVNTDGKPLYRIYQKMLQKLGKYLIWILT